MPTGHTEYSDWWKAYDLSSNPTFCEVPQVLKAPAPEDVAGAACTAPQVANPAGFCVDVARPAVQYYNAKSELSESAIARPSDAAWSLWNATLALTEAKAIENAETSPAELGGVPRTKAGEIEYWTGSKKSKLFANN